MGAKTRGIAVALTAGLLLVAAGCAKDEAPTTAPTTAPVTSSTGGGSGTTEAPDDTLSDEDLDELCGKLDDLNEADDSDIDGIADLILEIRNLVPADQTDDWDVLFDAFVELAEMDETTDDEEVDAIVTDPEFVEAADRIDAYGEDECDVDLGLGEDELAPTTTDDTSTAPIDPRLDDPDPDPGEDPTSIDAIQAHLEANYGSEVWWPVLDDASAWSMVNVVDPMLTITLSASSDWESLTTAELAAACDAVAEYLDTVEETDPGVEIVDPDEAELVSRYFRGEACAPDEGF